MQGSSHGGGSAADDVLAVGPAEAKAGGPCAGPSTVLGGTAAPREPVSLGGHSQVLAAHKALRYRGAGTSLSCPAVPQAITSKLCWIKAEGRKGSRKPHDNRLVLSSRKWNHV